MRMTITIGDQTFTLPARKEVCDDCGGHGMVLNPSMRHHAYSREEFLDAFDDEEQEDYFRRGGRYDVRCPTCKGQNVVDVPHEAAFTDEDREVFARWQDEQDAEAAQDRWRESERRMGC